MKKILIMLYIVTIANFHVYYASQISEQQHAEAQKIAQDEENKKKCIQYLVDNEKIVCMDFQAWKTYITKQQNFDSFMTQFGYSYFDLPLHEQMVIDVDNIYKTNKDVYLNFKLNILYFNKVLFTIVQQNNENLKKQNQQLNEENKKLVVSVNELQKEVSHSKDLSYLLAFKLQRLTRKKKKISNYVASN
ncbi:hypothetical protein IPH67_02190 [bacterium]|nr:MAG: hypothetical protein IPH67_02190 [bacterium]